MRAEPVVVLLWTPLKIQAQALYQALLALEHVQVVWASDEADAVDKLARTDAALLLGAGGGYTAAIADAVRSSPQLRWVQIFSTGIDMLEAQGIPAHLTFSGIGDAGAAPVAEHAMALLLALVRQLQCAIAQGRSAEWNRQIATSMRSLEGMRLGLVGCGAIGQGTARRAQGFGMTCVGINRSGTNPAPSLFDEVLPIQRRHEAFSVCDALVVSLPLTEQTRGLIGAADWRACKRGVHVISVGRGPVVQMLPLLEALEAGQVGAAGLDVTDPEPLPPDHPLWRHPNVLITPHVAGAGSAAMVARVCNLVVENIRRFCRGEAPLLQMHSSSKPA